MIDKLEEILLKNKFIYVCFKILVYEVGFLAGLIVLYMILFLYQ